MLYYIEVGIEHTLQYGDMWEQYYTALENNFGKALEHISKNCNPYDYKIRVKEMVNKVYHCGWGFYDGLSYFYEQYYTE